MRGGGGAEDISKLMVNFLWPLILSKYFFHAPPPFIKYNKFRGGANPLRVGGGGVGGE